MTTIREQLEESQKVCDAATEGPWEWRGGHWKNDLVKRVFIGDPNSDDFAERMTAEVHPHNILKATSDWAPTPADATFIAHARTELPLRNAQLAAVLELHKPEPNSCSALHPTPLCSCGAEHPCPTVRAIEDAAP